MKTRFFILLQYLLPQHFLSRLVGKLADWQMPRAWLNGLINLLIKKYHIDMQQAAEQDINQYPTFNAFFTRTLKAGARPIGADVVSPADGTISELGKIESDKILQAKQRHYTLNALLANQTEWVEKFQNGQFITVYLSPKDYHRVHMPYTGKLVASFYVPGKLFSVNPTTVNNVDGVFARNERLVNIFETDKGPMAVILVGAMLVAGISTVWQGSVVPNRFRTVQHYDVASKNILLNKGDELGYFTFGSTAIVLFGKDQTAWLAELQATTTLNMGEMIGR